MVKVCTHYSFERMSEVSSAFFQKTQIMNQEKRMTLVFYIFCQKISCFLESPTFKDKIESNGRCLHSNTILRYKLMDEIKYIHSEQYLGLHILSFPQKHMKGSKNSEVSVYHQKPRVVTKSCNRKAQKKKKKVKIYIVVKKRNVGL